MTFQKDFRVDETAHINRLVEYLQSYKYALKNIQHTTVQDATALRQNKLNSNGIDILMKTYPLHQDECRGLMELAESLIRVPDKLTSYHLITDKVSNQHWLRFSKNLTVLFYSVGLSITKYILKGYTPQKSTFLQKLALPFIHFFSKLMMKRMASQFILAENMKKAMARIKPMLSRGNTFSFDMLGETARTTADAEKYFSDYKDCLNTIKKNLHLVADKNTFSVSVKLTSLCPRYEPTQITEYFNDIYTKVFTLCKMAAEIDVPLFVDAEEADKLEFSFKIFEKILQEEILKNWQGFGVVIQSYQKRAFAAIDSLYNLAKSNQRKIYVRLVKGAYWDSEIKLDQVNGVEDFALFTRKEHTDISYMACVKKLAIYTDCIFPCFATHNIHTINFVKEVMQQQKYEYQCLFGMGEDVYENNKSRVRYYCPVGNFKTVLPYLIRRLLENGSKNNFVNAILHEEIKIDEVVENPISKAAKHGFSSHHLIKLPQNIYLNENRLNSKGVDMSDLSINENLQASINKVTLPKNVYPIINGEDIKTTKVTNITNPATKETLGMSYLATEIEVNKAFEVAKAGQKSWNDLGGNKRATILEKMANSLEDSTTDFITVLSKEAGKTIKDSILEIREAVDFLRYYAGKAREDFEKEFTLPSVDGEVNYIKLEGRGVFLCISPWNFPLAIFLGQIAGALAAGNTVVAKPAESTNMVAYMAIKKFLAVGLPNNVLQLILGEGRSIGNTLVENPQVAGIAFTGSDATARNLNRLLAKREDYIIPLIAETGGQNCMIVDSTALLDQVAKDVVASAFQSAGQRCSALRVLYLQEEIFEEQIKLIQGVSELLNIGLPWNIATDVGPIINQKSLDSLIHHKEAMKEKAKLLFEVPYAENLYGYFFTPCAFEIASINMLPKEVFGPILHIIKYKAKDLEKVIQDINSTGYGLTFGLHTRIDDKVKNIINNINCGNLYINRNQIGAVVGSQPFGGRGKSGTGPKAGGPFYLHRFATEKTVTIDITAQGGNRNLLNI